MNDVTDKYRNMIDAFEADFTLAADACESFELGMLQEKIEDGDGRLLADISLLSELSFGIRCGLLKIMQTHGHK